MAATARMNTEATADEVAEVLGRGGYAIVERLLALLTALAVLASASGQSRSRPTSNLQPPTSSASLTPGR